MSEMADDNFDAGTASYSRGSGKGWKVLVVILIIIIIVILGWFAFVTMGKGAGIGGDKIAPVDNSWQAVFLTNGQVYFGKVKSVGEETLGLSEIYYLQVVTRPLQTSQVGTNQPAQTQQELTLIKLGNEIHGPQDSMTINRDQILLTEKLKNDSKVVEAINNYLKEQQKPATK